MTNVLFKRLIIFDTHEEKAVSVEFKSGVNVITSSETNGTDRGKSVLLRSLYHSLGADAHFDSKWNEKNKRYISFFEVDGVEYSVYRYQHFFKIFKSEQLLFTTNSRAELADILGDLFNFKIFLPKKTDGSLGIAPPAYSYLLNFLDQDYYNGTKFSSFKSLAQFSNFKLDVIYSHLGVYNQDYFELIREKESIEGEIRSLKQSKNDTQSMKERTLKILEGVSCPESSVSLENELLLETQRYSTLLNEMNIIRNKLVNLRNQLEEQKITENQLSTFSRKQESEIKQIVKSHICPECSSILSDTISIKSRKYNLLENIITLKDSIKMQAEKINKEIEKNETKYTELSLQLEELNTKITKNQKDIKDYAKFKGLNTLIDELNNDLVQSCILTEEFENSLKPIKNEIKIVKKQKNRIDEKYFSLIDQLKNSFQLNELESQTYEKISSSFCASGSNKPLSTVIWYIVLNQLKSNYNPNGTFFPMIFDSPNNAEMDNDKKYALIQYILEMSSNFQQLIISAIGFDCDEHQIGNDINVTILDNDKYNLLNSESYLNNLELLMRMNGA